MTTYTTTDTELTSIANAIRTKGGTTELLIYPDDFIVAIGQIEAGGGGNVYQDENGYIVLDDEASEGMITAIPLSVTANGTYTAAEHVAYTPVTVNVAPTLQTKTKNYTPSTTSQSETIIADTGYDGLSSVDITVSAMPAGTAGTPSAAKGTVSNHAVTITPTVTNTTGYITGGTKNGTAISVSAGELVSGTYTVDAGGTADVTNYASISVTAMTLPTTTSSTSSGTLKATFAAPTSDKYLNIPVGYNSTASYYKLSAVTGITLPTSLATTSTGTSKAVLAPHATAARYLNIPTGYNATASFYTISAPTAMTLPTTTATTSTGTLKATFAAPTSDKYLNIPTGYNATASYYKLSAVTAMTVPTTTAATGSGTLKLTVTPNTSTQYINIPTGYNSSAVNYKINPIPSDYIVPTGTITISSNAIGIDVSEYATANVSVDAPTPVLEDKIVTPSTTQQTITAGTGYDGLGTVTVNAIPSDYIIPTGTYTITSSGDFNITEYAEVSVASGNVGAPVFTTEINVSTHKATITATVTGTAGYITNGSTSTYTTISASSLVSGTYSVTTTGTIDVTNYKNIEVAAMTLPTTTSSTSSGSRNAVITPIVSTTQYINIPTGYNVTASYYQINAVTAMTLPTDISTSASGSKIATLTPQETGTRYLNIPAGYNSTSGYYQINAPTAITLPATLATTSTGTSKATLTPNATADRYLNIPVGYNSTAQYYTIKAPTAMTLPASTSSSGTGNTKLTVARSSSDQYINIPVGYNATAANYKIPAMGDYVVEQGVTGAWTYRKWESGIAECWGDSASGSRTTNTTWGNIYYSTTTIGSMAYPSGLFTTTPVATLDFIATTNDAWTNIHRDGTKDNAPTAYVYRPNNGTVEGFCRCYARGTWK